MLVDGLRDFALCLEGMILISIGLVLTRRFVRFVLRAAQRLARRPRRSPAVAAAPRARGAGPTGHSGSSSAARGPAPGSGTYEHSSSLVSLVLGIGLAHDMMHSPLFGGCVARGAPIMPAGMAGSAAGGTVGTLGSTAAAPNASAAPLLGAGNVSRCDAVAPSCGSCATPMVLLAPAFVACALLALGARAYAFSEAAARLRAADALSSPAGAPPSREAPAEESNGTGNLDAAHRPTVAPPPSSFVRLARALHAAAAVVLLSASVAAALEGMGAPFADVAVTISAAVAAAGALLHIAMLQRLLLFSPAAPPRSSDVAALLASERESRASRGTRPRPPPALPLPSRGTMASARHVSVLLLALSAAHLVTASAGWSYFYSAAGMFIRVRLRSPQPPR